MHVIVDIDEKWPIYSLRVGEGKGSIDIPEQLFEEYHRIQLEYYTMQKTLAESYHEQSESSISTSCGGSFSKGSKSNRKHKQVLA